MKEHLELSSLGASLLAEAERISGDMQDWRRDFHQFPELAFEENITASKITHVLRSIPGMAVTSGFAIQTSVIGVLGSDIPGPALMLRATMDATAAEEQTGLPFSSCMPGAMHGCGHDAEMASLLGAAAVLSKYSDELKQRVVFLFQPAGEGRSGAKTLTENNIIDKFNIGRSVAVNWSSELPYGELFTRRGVMTALSDRIHIDIRGTAGHAAEPHMTVDPVTIAANLIIMIQTMLSREVDPREPVVVSFGQVESGEAYNIIPEQANLWGTLRAFDPKVRDFVQSRIETVAPALAKALRGAARRSGAAGLWTDGGLFGGGAAAVDQRGETRQCRYAALLRRGGDPQRRGRSSAAGTRGPPVDKGQLGRQVLFPQPGTDGGALCGWLVRYLRYREV